VHLNNLNAPVLNVLTTLISKMDVIKSLYMNSLENIIKKMNEL